MTAVLINWVLTASALTAAVLLLCALFGKRMSARLRYALWLLVLVRLLVPGQFFTAPVETPPALSNAPVLQTLPNIRQPLETEQEESGEAGLPVQAIPEPSEEKPATGPAARKPLDPLAALLGIWLTGSAVMAAAFLTSNFSFARKLRRVRTPLEADCPLPVYVASGLPSPLPVRRSPPGGLRHAGGFGPGGPPACSGPRGHPLPPGRP